MKVRQKRSVIIRIKPGPRTAASIVVTIVPNNPLDVLIFDVLQKGYVIHRLQAKFFFVINFFVIFAWSA